ncbi:MAG: GntR family transcriptional regulator [Nodosilinea sp.]
MPSSHPYPKPTENMVYAELYEAICERQLRPDTKLGEVPLAEHFGVSRTIIRQALQRLGADGLVKLEQNRGAFVASISLAEAQQIYAAWRLVEEFIIRDVTSTITAAQAESLRQLIAEERQACRDGNFPRLTRLSTRFHIRLAELSQNRFLGQFLKDLIPLTALAYFYEIDKMPLCLEDEHSKILDYIVAGDANQAVAAAQRHLDGIEAALNARATLEQPISLVDRLKARNPSL